MTPNLLEIKCKICDTGSLYTVRRYRMSGIVVFIGYILLIPSILGVLFSIFGFISVANATSAPHDATAFAGGVFMLFGVAALVGGLLGWILIMKKQILQCNRCGAVVAAS